MGAPFLEDGPWVGHGSNRVTYVILLLGPVQPVLSFGKVLTPVPKPIFDGKLKEGRKSKFQNRTDYFIRETHFNQTPFNGRLVRDAKYKMYTSTLV